MFGSTLTIPPLLDQSVLDWASPDEESNNPTKCGSSGRRLESFHKLRTRDANNQPGVWTINHAIHVARWEAYQAGNTEAFKEPLGVFDSFDLMLVIEELKQIHRASPTYMAEHDPIFERHHRGFVEASAQAVFDLETSTHQAVASLQKKRFRTPYGTDEHSTESFPKQTRFLAARLSSPTGTLPISLEKTLEDLGLSEYLHFKKQSRPKGSIIDRTEPALESQRMLKSSIDGRIEAALEKQRQLNNNIIEEGIKAALQKQQKLSESVIQDHVKTAVEKQRKLNDSIIQDSIKAVLKIEISPYQALLNDYMDFTDHLAKGLTTLGDLADKAKNLKIRWVELNPTAPKETVPLLQKVEAGESNQAE